MTALLGMGRKGMISVWSSIWSVPLAGCRRGLPLYASMISTRENTHTHFWILFSHFTQPRQPISSTLCGVVPPIKMSTQQRAGCPSWCLVVRSPTSSSVFISASVVFQGEIGLAYIQFRQLWGHILTFYKISFTAGVIGMGYWGLFFKRLGMDWELERRNWSSRWIAAVWTSGILILLSI